MKKISTKKTLTVTKRSDILLSMKNILKYPAINEMFQTKSLEALYKEKKEIESRSGRGLNGIRKMLVLNCLEEVIKEKELELV